MTKQKVWIVTQTNDEGTTWICHVCRNREAAEWALTQMRQALIYDGMVDTQEEVDKYYKFDIDWHDIEDKEDIEIATPPEDFAAPL